MKLADLWKIKIIVVLLLVGSSPLVWATTQISAAKFVKANFDYKNGRYDEAIKSYEEILAGGRASGALYYNLGNAYFQKNALGKAILNYERARRLIPRDPDRRANHQYALSLVKNPSDPGKRSWQNILDRSFDLFTLDELALSLLVLIMMTGSLHLLFLYLRWTNRFRLLIFPLLIALIAGSGFFGKMKSQEGLAVTVAETPAKFEPRQEATIHFDLPEGNQVKVLKTDGVWVKIERPDGKEGWVPRETVAKIEQGP